MADDTPGGSRGDTRDGQDGGPFGSAQRMGSVFGVPLRVHWSAPFLVVLLGLSLGAGTLPGWVPGRSHTVYALAGAAGALLLMAGLVLHEGAHAVVARRAGVPVRDMTVWALGGATRMERAGEPRAALAVAAAGPLASLLAGGVSLGAAFALLDAAHWTLAGDVLLWVGWANILLAGFNLLPASPLDGGRVLQAALWWGTGDRGRSERVAGRGGRILGWALVVLGALLLFRGGLGGIWLMLTGFFVSAAAQAELRQSALRATLHGIRLGEVMSAPVVTAPGWLTVDDFVEQVARVSRHSHLPLLDPSGQVTGVVSLRRVAHVPAPLRAGTRIAELAVPLAQCVQGGPEQDLGELVERLTAGAAVRILVLEGRQLVGIVTAHDISRVVQRQLSLARGAGGAGGAWRV